MNSFGVFMNTGGPSAFSAYKRSTLDVPNWTRAEGDAEDSLYSLERVLFRKSEHKPVLEDGWQLPLSWREFTDITAVQNFRGDCQLIEAVSKLSTGLIKEGVFSKAIYVEDGKEHKLETTLLEEMVASGAEGLIETILDTVSERRWIPYRMLIKLDNIIARNERELSGVATIIKGYIEDWIAT